MKKVGGLLILALAAVMLCSCGPKSQDGVTSETGKGKPVSIAFVTNNVSDFWKIAEAGVKVAEKEFNAKCEVQMPVQGTAAEQKRILEDLIVKGVTGVAISPVNPDKVDMLDKAAEKVNLITMDSDAPKSKRLCYVGTSNIDAGKVAGKELMEALPDGGKVMVYVGTMDAQNAADRYKGLEQALKDGKSKIQILGIMTDNTDRTKARSNVEDTLVKYNDIAGLVGLWAYNGPAIYKAVKAANKVGKVKIISFDEDPVTLEGIKEGAIYATIIQQPYEFGYESVRILAGLARDDKSVLPENGILDTGVEVIDKNNVDKFSARLKELLGEK